jgi:hypothetical protein
LRNCRKGIQDNGKALLIVFVIKPSKSAGLRKMAGFEHACDFGLERTAEFRDVYSAAGFCLSQIIPAGGLSIIEGRSGVVVLRPLEEPVACSIW